MAFGVVLFWFDLVGFDGVLVCWLLMVGVFASDFGYVVLLIAV